MREARSLTIEGVDDNIVIIDLIVKDDQCFRTEGRSR